MNCIKRNEKFGDLLAAPTHSETVDVDVVISLCGGANSVVMSHIISWPASVGQITRGELAWQFSLYSNRDGGHDKGWQDHTFIQSVSDTCNDDKNVMI